MPSSGIPRQISAEAQADRYQSLVRLLVINQSGSMLSNAAPSGGQSRVSRVQLWLLRRTGGKTMRLYRYSRMSSGRHDSASSFMHWAVESEEHVATSTMRDGGQYSEGYIVFQHDKHCLPQVIASVG
ncbi:hypothetical protein PIIN_11547 [Serendipita indica DSM 11827]|uniref:Uncharacterized protein n=1 Tax=Serendipita indica (strain DSM 11827) TaxID=1109443 RepID=G4U1X7_SERID|nr:hypothetical protein PIIN_11547 [Serendipita indica DSM 11827]